MYRLTLVCITTVLLSCLAILQSPLAEDTLNRVIELDKLKSGKAFQLPETQALQDDNFANPGQLWIDKGSQLWAEPAGAADKSCANCHELTGEDLRGIAARYPIYSKKAKRLVNLEQQINICREQYQKASPLAYESEQLLALTTFVANLSIGYQMNVSIDAQTRSNFESGRAYYYKKRGQLNLACNQCHEQNWGQMLRGDRISQGHSNGYPTYRFEWQSLGSLHRRIRDCDEGVRAEPFDFGSDEYVNLELFLAWRATGLEIEAPAVRR